MDVEQRVRRIVAEQLSACEAKVTTAASFVDDLGADSLDIAGLVLALEDDFGVELPDTQVEKITTVQEVIDFLRANQKT